MKRLFGIAASSLLLLLPPEKGAAQNTVSPPVTGPAPLSAVPLLSPLQPSREPHFVFVDILERGCIFTQTNQHSLISGGIVFGQDLKMPGGTSALKGDVWYNMSGMGETVDKDGKFRGAIEAAPVKLKALLLQITGPDLYAESVSAPKLRDDCRAKHFAKFAI